MVEDAPFAVTADFLRAHAITTVVHGDDLSMEQAEAIYGPAVASGRLILVRRSGDLSTTELIRRVRESIDGTTGL